MSEIQAQLDSVAIPSGLWWLFAAWPFAVALVLMVAVRLEGLRHRARLVAHVGGWVGLGLGVWAISPVASHSWQWWPGLGALRIGSLDASLDIALDPLSAGVALVVLLLLAGGLSVGAETLGPSPSRDGVASLARLPLFAGAALYAVVAGNWLGLALGWLGAGLAARAMADDLAPSLKSGLRAGVVAGRLGEAALITAVALTFWGSGGRWLHDGFRPDYRERFRIVLEPAAEASRAPSGQFAQRPPASALPGRIPRPPALQTKPKAPPLRRPPPQFASASGGMATLSMTTHPGAQVYLGIAEMSDLKANLGALPRCEEQPTWTASEGPQLLVSCVTTAPFVAKRIASGRQRLAIVPGRGGTVSGRGDEAAAIELRLEPGMQARIVALGAGLGFVDTVHQAAVGPKLDLPASLDDAARRPRESAWLFLLAALGMALSAGVVRPLGIDEQRKRLGPVLAGVGQALPMLLAGYLLARFTTLGAGLPMGGAMAGAMAAVVGALMACQARDGAALMSWLAVAHGGAVVAALGLASVEVAVALGLAHAAVWATVMGPLALDPKPPQSLHKTLGLKHKVSPLVFYAAVGAVLAVAGMLPLGGFFARAAGLASLSATGSPPRWVAWGLLLAAQFGVALAAVRLVRCVFTGDASASARRVGKAERGPSVVLPAVAVVWIAGGLVASVSTASLGGGDPGLWRGWMGAPGSGAVLIAGLVLGSAVAGAVRSAPGSGRDADEPAWMRADPVAQGGEVFGGLLGRVEDAIGQAGAAAGAPIEAAGVKLGLRGSIMLAALLLVALVAWVGRA